MSHDKIFLLFMCPLPNILLSTACSLQYILLLCSGKTENIQKSRSASRLYVYCHPVYLTYMQSSVQFSRSVVSLTLCDPMDYIACQASITNSQSLLKFMSITCRVHHVKCRAG